MIEFFVFLYGLAAAFVLVAVQRNLRLQRAHPQMVIAVGWGLFSLSATLAVLLGAFALAMALGAPVDQMGLAGF